MKKIISLIIFGLLVGCSPKMTVTKAKMPPITKQASKKTYTGLTIAIVLVYGLLAHIDNPEKK